MFLSIRRVFYSTNVAPHYPVQTIEVKFTIDKRPNLWYTGACYLEQASLRHLSARALTPTISIACRLLKSLASLLAARVLCFQ